MRIKYLLFIFLLVFLFSLNYVTAYTNQSYNNITLTLTSAYTNQSYNNITLVLRTNPATTNTCSWTSGNWEINLNDNCTITTNYELGNNNITFIGVGNVTFNSQINATKIGGLPANQKGYIGVNARIKVLK